MPQKRLRTEIMLQRQVGCSESHCYCACYWQTVVSTMTWQISPHPHPWLGNQESLVVCDSCQLDLESCQMADAGRTEHERVYNIRHTCVVCPAVVQCE